MMKRDRSLEFSYTLICRVVGIVLLLAVLTPAAPARAVDEGNRLICHKHRGMSYIDEIFFKKAPAALQAVWLLFGENQTHYAKRACANDRRFQPVQVFDHL